MSAALTMPGLFPLVGIAGEDDRDAFDLALQNVDPGAKNGPPEKKYGSHGSHEACASKRAPRASQGRKRCLCHSACNIDPPYCRISKCYPDGTDAKSTGRPRHVAFPACSTRGAVGGSGP